ncbi:MAG TPA: CvpA family protein [Ktedonobacteraceae bacterium]|nr:CvpA family protein [Ktedonobacteraceae bacterium]
MIGPFNWIDLLFVITVVLLVFNGLRNGAVVSIINLLSIPVALFVALYFGKTFTFFLASNGIGISPLIAYIILFFAAVILIHILGTVLRGVIKAIPLIGAGDALLGGAVGFIEAWLLWLIVLLVVGNVLHGVQNSFLAGTHIFSGFDVTPAQLISWHDAYNQAITTSLFAKVNGWFVQALPALPKLQKV